MAVVVQSPSGKSRLRSVTMKRSKWSTLLMLSLATLAAAVVSGCSPSGQIQIATPLTAAIPMHHEIAIAVTSSSQDPSKPQERAQLETATRNALSEANRIVAAAAAKDGRNTKGVLLEMSVTGIRRVSRGARVMHGAMVGRASITVQVRLLDAADKAVLGSATITGVSSGGNVFAGTTDDAIIEAAKAISKFINSKS